MNLKQFCDHYWYKLRDEIPSWWDRYRNWIPSVTTILSLIVDPGFEWIKKNNNEQLQNAIIRWKKTHADAESFFNGDIATLHKQILKFHIINSVEIISQEELYEKDISWTIDLVASLMLNWVRVEMNIDYKSSLYLNPKYKLQLAWYRYLNWLDWWLLYLGDKKYIFDYDIWEQEYLIFLELKNLFFNKMAQWMFEKPRS